MSPLEVLGQVVRFRYIALDMSLHLHTYVLEGFLSIFQINNFQKNHLKAKANMVNKAFVLLGSCDNFQTEWKIFEYANKASNKKNWSVLVRSAGPLSWSVQLVHPLGLSS